MLKRLKPLILIEIFIHLLFWAFVTILPVLSGPFSNTSNHLWPARHFVLINTIFAIQFYLIAFWLIPEILNKKNKIGLYFGLLAI